jgi:hypothetical protein
VGTGTQEERTKSQGGGVDGVLKTMKTIYTKYTPHTDDLAENIWWK